MILPHKLMQILSAYVLFNSSKSNLLAHKLMQIPSVYEQ